GSVFGEPPRGLRRRESVVEIAGNFARDGLDIEERRIRHIIGYISTFRTVVASAPPIDTVNRLMPGLKCSLSDSRFTRPVNSWHDSPRLPMIIVTRIGRTSSSLMAVICASRVYSLSHSRIESGSVPSF